jgi:hypothetical protein
MFRPETLKAITSPQLSWLSQLRRTKLNDKSRTPQLAQFSPKFIRRWSKSKGYTFQAHCVRP